jgi:hypothetical protein
MLYIILAQAPLYQLFEVIVHNVSTIFLINMSRKEWGKTSEKAIYRRLMICAVNNLWYSNVKLLGKELMDMLRHLIIDEIG